MFLPMRTAFVYDMEEHDSNADVPTTLRRSKEDCPPVSQLHQLLTFTCLNSSTFQNLKAHFP